MREAISNRRAGRRDRGPRTSTKASDCGCANIDRESAQYFSQLLEDEEASGYPRSEARVEDLPVERARKG
jgi:hypothetical protein